MARKKYKKRGESAEKEKEKAMETEESGTEKEEEWKDERELRLWEEMKKKMEKWYDGVVKECKEVLLEAKEDAREKGRRDEAAKGVDKSTGRSPG